MIEAAFEGIKSFINGSRLVLDSFVKAANTTFNIVKTPAFYATIAGLWLYKEKVFMPWGAAMKFANKSLAKMAGADKQAAGSKAQAPAEGAGGGHH